MHPVIAKTFGGLSAQYYFRQFVFGAAITAFIVFMSTQGTQPIKIGMILFMAVSTMLYPYSRFVYDSIVGFVMGQNVFVLPMLVMLAAKLVTMIVCWTCAVFIAPVGLAYLYFHHSKSAR
jgi:hypothetical protein